MLTGGGKIGSRALSRYNRLFADSSDLTGFADEEDKIGALAASAMAARTGVPDSHRRAADNYMVIKKIYGAPVVRLGLSPQEKNLLAKYDFNPLEYCTIKQINEEISFLKRWSSSESPALKKDADDIIQIRAKELKCLAASRYNGVSGGMYSGCIALERYFEGISKYKI